MNIDSIKNGFVIDHIEAGKSLEVYKYLNLEKLDTQVAIIKNAKSNKSGKKDIIKIDENTEINLDILGYLDSKITINKIIDGKIVEKYHPELPEQLVNIIKCKNPRCITSTEQGLPHICKLTDRENSIYRCKYCEGEVSRD
jgi:aspartate carbamoyltransferase regulatory subunit